jgi:hypothetical protein
MLITGAQFAKFMNCARQNIYKHVREKKLVKTNGKYDLLNAANLNYVISHGKTKNDVEKFFEEIKVKPKVKKTPKKKTTSKKKPTKPKIKKEKVTKIEKKPIKAEEKKKDVKSNTEYDDFENVTGLPASMMNLNIKQLVSRYGGPMMLKNWADILNKLMLANEKDQKIQIKNLDVIEKKFIQSNIFSYLETLSKQMFNIKFAITDEIISLVLAEKTKSRKKIHKIIDDAISVLIKDAKDNIEKELERLKNQFDKSIDLEGDDD